MPDPRNEQPPPWRRYALLAVLLVGLIAAVAWAASEGCFLGVGC